MLEIWMKNNLVSDNNYNIVNLLSPPPTKSQGMTNNVGLTYMVTLYCGLQFVLSKKIIVGDTKYHGDKSIRVGPIH